jgi:hypothetical protein
LPFPAPQQSHTQLSGEKEKKEKIMNPLIQFRKTVVSFVITVVLACFGLLPKTQAVSPPPDGDYPGGNTAEGFKALFSLNTQNGGFNTAIGFSSLAANVTGSFNTAVGAGALDLNTSHNADRKPYTVRYDAVNAMLLNEFLKEHRKVREQEATISEWKCKLKRLLRAYRK